MASSGNTSAMAPSPSPKASKPRTSQEQIKGASPPSARFRLAADHGDFIGWAKCSGQTGDSEQEVSGGVTGNNRKW
jgi:hypothetical protein